MKPTIHQVGSVARLMAIQTDRFKSELLTVQYAIPIKQETAQRAALMLELLRRGTERYPTKAKFYRHLDDLYASSITPYNKRAGDMQLLGVSADFLGSRFVGGGEGLLPEIVSMLSELLYHPYLPNGEFHTPYVDSEKQHLRDALRARINNPRALAHAKCRALLCKDEPYALSLIGEEDSVNALDPQTLTGAWQELICHVTPTFFYVGSTDPERVAGLLAAAFEGAGSFTYPAISDIHAQLAPVRRAEEEMPLCQGKLSVGYRTDIGISHPLSAAMLVLNEIFGGSAASKLFLNVRERRSLCYHCSSSLDLYKGVMFANSGMKPKNREVTEAAIRQEFEAIRSGEISDVELNAAKRSLDHAYRQMSDTPAAMAEFYMRRALFGVCDTLNERREALLGVSRKDIALAADRLSEGAVFFLKGTLEGEEVDEE